MFIKNKSDNNKKKNKEAPMEVNNKSGQNYDSDHLTAKCR